MTAPLSAHFVTAYLQEIGVQTPLLPAYRAVTQPTESNRPLPVKALLQHMPTIQPAVAKPVAPQPIITPPVIDKQPVPPAAITIPVVQTDTPLSALAQQVACCTACDLSQRRTQTVFACGDPAADLMFIGEAPGADDDRQGEPFVGKIGQLLNRMINAIGMKREQVYLTHSIKCMPPWNRDPSGQEVAACRAYLDAQIHAVKPRVICLLGRIAAHHVLNTDDSL
ncbi:MAG: uracil-DNA glycosylase, partial [Mariprofundaceae bacterium]|nr:uracil-DNA glycosylase [Mariprofundaceae bacterium]